MNRRNFVQAAAGLFPMGWFANSSRPTEQPEISEHSRPEPLKLLDIRGVMAMYDLPDPRPKSIWHSYQDFFLFDARKDRRYDGDFWDQERWNRYLSLWSQEGYNTVFWY